MIQFFMSILTTLICSASFALYQQTSTEFRTHETWVTINVDASKEGAKADVLFVIDDSGSMGTHQKNLSTQAGLIAQELSFYSDINAGVITTSKSKWSTGASNAGKLVGPVLNTTTTPNFVEVLSKQMLVGQYGDATEVFFDNIFSATTEPLISTDNAGFLRPNADLLLVLLTDTEDQGIINAATLYQHLQQVKPHNQLNIISVTPANTQTCPGENDVLTKYNGIKDLVSLMNGQTVDLCSDFSKEFPKAIHQVKIKIREITLEAFQNTQIDYSSLTVKADGALLPIGNTVSGWVYDTNKSKVILGSDVINNDNIQQITVSYKLIK